MTKTKIEFADYTWNPVSGCFYKCPYCYARRNARRFAVRAKDPVEIPEEQGGGVVDMGELRGAECETGQIHEIEYPSEFYPYGFDPTFFHSRLDDPFCIKKPQTIFVGSMCDLFGEWVSDEWLRAVFAAIDKAPWHTYLFLSKNPKRYFKPEIYHWLCQHRNVWVGTTVEDTMKYLERGTDLPPYDNKFISCEPLLEPVNFDWGACFSLKHLNVKAIITGADSTRGAVTPKAEWFEKLRKDCDEAGVMLFEKNSVSGILGELRHELPWEIHKKIGGKQ
jgi:protein gp37